MLKMSGKRGQGTDYSEIEDTHNKSSEKIPITCSPLEPPAVDDPDKKVKPKVEADPEKTPKEKQDSYPPIITIDGRVDTDIDHLIEDLADDYHGPVDEIPSKFPKPHVFSVIEGSLDDDVDSFANDDGTMEHTLVDAPKNFNPKDLQDVASSEVSRKSSAGHSKLGQMQSSQTDRSHNKMHAETFENETPFQQRKSNDGFKKKRCKEVLTENHSRDGSKYIKKTTPNLRKKVEENSKDTTTIVQIGDSEDAVSANSNVCKPDSFTQVQTEVSTNAPELGRDSWRNSSDHLQRPKISRAVVTTNGHSHVSDCHSDLTECKPNDTDSAFFMHAYTESLTYTFTDESFRERQFSLDKLRKNQTQGRSFSETDSEDESLGITSNLFECGCEPRLRHELKQTLYHFPSYSDESLTRSSELYPRSRHLPHSNGHAASAHILHAGQPLAHGQCTLSATDFTRTDRSTQGQSRLANASFSSQCVNTCFVHEQDHDSNREPKNTFQISNQSSRKKTKLTLVSAFTNAESSKTHIILHDNIACSEHSSESLVSNKCNEPLDQSTVKDTCVSKAFSDKETQLRPSISVTHEIKTYSLQEDIGRSSRCKSTKKLNKIRPQPGIKSDKKRILTEPKSLTSVNLQNVDTVKQAHMNDFVVQNIQEKIAASNSKFNAQLDSNNMRHQQTNISDVGNILNDRMVMNLEEIHNGKSCYRSSDSESLDSESHYLLHQLRHAHMTKKKAKSLLRHVQNILGDSDKPGEKDIAGRETTERMLESSNKMTSSTNQETFQYHNNNIFNSPEGTQTMTKTLPFQGTQTDSQHRSDKYYDSEDPYSKLKSLQNCERGLVQSLVNSWDKKHQNTVGSKLNSSDRIFKPAVNLLSVAALEAKVQQADVISQTVNGDNTVKTRDTVSTTHANTNSVMTPFLLEENSQQARCYCQKPFSVQHFCKEVNQPSKVYSSQEEETNDRQLENRIIHDIVQLNQIKEYRNQPVCFTFYEMNEEQIQLGDKVCNSTPTEEAEEHAFSVSKICSLTQEYADKSGIKTLADNHAVKIKDVEEDETSKKDLESNIETQIMAAYAVPVKQSRKTKVTTYRVSQDLTRSMKDQAVLVPAHQCYSCRATAFSSQKNRHSLLLANKACQADSDLNYMHHARTALRETRRDKVSGPTPLQRVAATPGHRLNVSASSLSLSPESTPDEDSCAVRFSQAGLKYLKEEIGKKGSRSLPRKTRHSATAERLVSPDHYSFKELTYSKPKTNSSLKRMKTRSSSMKDALKVAYKIAEESKAAATRVAEALNVVIKTSQMSPMSSSAEVKVCLKRHTKDRVVSSSSRRGNEKTKLPVDQLQLLLSSYSDMDITNQKTIKSYSREKEAASEKAKIEKTTVPSQSYCDRSMRYKPALTSPVKGETIFQNSKNVRSNNKHKHTKIKYDSWRQLLYKDSPLSNGCDSPSWGQKVGTKRDNLIESGQEVPRHEEHSTTSHLGVRQLDEIMLEYTNNENTYGSQIIPSNAWPNECMCFSDNSEHVNSSRLRMVNAEEDSIIVKGKSKPKKNVRGSAIADQDESSKFNVSRAQWILPKLYNSSLQKMDGYFTKTPPVLDQNLKSISLSAKQVLRRQMTGSCVDPGQTDSAGSDSLEYNSNFNRSLPGRHVQSYQERNHILESDYRLTNIYNRCCYETVKEHTDVSNYVSEKPIETKPLNLASPAQTLLPLRLSSSLDVRLDFYSQNTDSRKNSTETRHQGQSQTSAQLVQVTTGRVSGVDNTFRLKDESSVVECVANLSTTSSSSQNLRLQGKQSIHRRCTKSLIGTTYVPAADSKLKEVIQLRTPEPTPRTLTLQCRDREDASLSSRVLQSHKFSPAYEEPWAKEEGSWYLGDSSHFHNLRRGNNKNNIGKSL